MVDIKEVLQKEFENNDRQPDLDKVRRILTANDGARIRTWLSICSRCGLCAERCPTGAITMEQFHFEEKPQCQTP